MPVSVAAMRPCPAEPVQSDRYKAQDYEVPKGGVIVHVATLGPVLNPINPG
jgi:hypothetical protein